MRGLVVAALLAIALAPSTGETKLGGGVTVKDSTPIEALLERPEEFVGKTIRIDGVATAVCEHMGCWMAVAPDGAEKDATVRLKVKDGVIVFPLTAKGKEVSAEGVFEAVGRDSEAVPLVASTRP